MSQPRPSARSSISVPTGGDPVADAAQLTAALDGVQTEQQAYDAGVAAIDFAAQVQVQLEKGDPDQWQKARNDARSKLYDAQSEVERGIISFDSYSTSKAPIAWYGPGGVRERIERLWSLTLATAQSFPADAGGGALLNLMDYLPQAVLSAVKETPGIVGQAAADVVAGVVTPVVGAAGDVLDAGISATWKPILYVAGLAVAALLLWHFAKREVLHG